MSTGFARMSCSACARRSAAHRVGLASSSAITSVSVGPYSPSTPTSPKTSFLASVVKRPPGPADHIDPGDRLRPVGHGGDGLRPSYLEDTVHARYVCRHQHDGMDALVYAGICCDDDLVHARNPRGNYRHQHRRGKPCRAARNVYADALDRVDQFAVPLAVVHPTLRHALLLEAAYALGGQPQSVNNLAVSTAS